MTASPLLTAAPANLLAAPPSTPGDEWSAPADEREHFGSDEQGVTVNLDGEGPILIAFGGMAGISGPPPFEFSRMTRELACRSISVRDHHRAWYHRGALQAGNSFRGLVAHLRGLLDASPPGRLVVVGNSAGGYAALVAGALLGADEVLAFVARTALTEDVCAPLGDGVWDSRRRSLIAGPHDASLVDVRDVLLAQEATRTLSHVFYDRHHHTDAAYATRLADVPNVVLHGYPSGGHVLIQDLRKDGTLNRLLTSALHH